MCSFSGNHEKGGKQDGKKNTGLHKRNLEVIRSNISPAVLSKRLQDFHENDIADVLPELSSAERNKLYRIFDLDTLSDILEYTDEEMASLISKK